MSVRRKPRPATRRRRTPMMQPTTKEWDGCFKLKRDGSWWCVAHEHWAHHPFEPCLGNPDT